MMTQTLTLTPAGAHQCRRPRRRRWVPLVVLTAAVATAVATPEITAPVSAQLPHAAPRLHVATAVFCALVVQALPFVLAGAAASAAVASVMTPARWARLLPARPAAAVATAVAAGMVVPTCECASVPLARRMIASGVPAPAAVAFMVAAPSLNPLVIAATWHAFGGWQMAATRAAAALIAVAGLAAAAASPVGRRALAGLAGGHGHDHHDSSGHDHGHGSGRGRVRAWAAAAADDAVTASGFLIAGAGVAGAIAGIIPARTAALTTDEPVLAVLVMAAMAVVACLCSMGDAFVAASMVGAAPAGLLAFLVVGPIIDIKLAMMMEGVLGARPARFLTVAGLAAGIVATIVVAAVRGWL